MLYKTMTSGYIILGSCRLFACRCCLTKYGWEHQEWCEVCSLTQPTCRDCRYYSERHSRCEHPVMKKRENGGFAV